MIAKIDPTNVKIHSFPETLKIQATTALSFYPELKDVPIEFKYVDKMSTSVMKAQPKFKTLFRSKTNREYVIFISRNFNIDGKEFHTSQIPKHVIIGWLGHELGHVMDYQTRNSLNLIAFGIRYVLFPKFTRLAEITADRYAIQHKMKDYILATKEYILNHSDLSDRYKARIKRLYASPEEILALIEEES